MWNHTKKQFIEVNLDNFVIKSYLNPKDLSVREQKYTYRKKVISSKCWRVAVIKNFHIHILLHGCRRGTTHQEGIFDIIYQIQANWSKHFQEKETI